MTHYLAQIINAERWWSQEHERLLAEGYSWDGMDGYYKKESDMPVGKKNWAEIARGAIERHLGDVIPGEDVDQPSPDTIYDEARTLAHDALIEAGCDPATAARVADDEARKVAQP